MSAVPITVPGVGESISEGILSRWLKPDGSAVKAGEPLFELETDKASSVVPAPVSGVLKVAVPEGETVAIGSTVGTLDPMAAPAPSTKAASSGPKEPGDGQGKAEAARMPLSPAVRRIVTEKDVDAAQVSATGPGGRITKGDVLTYLEAAPKTAPEPRPASKTTPAPTSVPPTPIPSTPPRDAGSRETRQRMSGLRQRIAQRLVEAQQTAAILTTFNEADLSAVIGLRIRFKELFRTRYGVGLGFMSFFVKAVAEALHEFPVVNARIEGNEIVFHNYHDIGVAVSTDRGLMVPVLRDVDSMSFAAIEKAVAGFGEKARAGTISVDELQGGTFTITNGGIFGSLLSTPILNPPQSAILGMHAIKKRPVVVDDQIVVRPMMYLALSYDHRIIDGREAVSFLVRIKDCIEDPERLMLAV
jgi:2-oxoglutarate dehydrogenase E2 component (dihydrolipoamide succinyltransferase)